MPIKYTLFILFLICPFCIFSQINFDSQPYSTCLNEAKEDSKPFVVYFYADWCLPCQIMEETTFQSSEVATALNEYMTPYKVEYDSELSKAWQDDYAVTCLPTMIFFDTDGNVTERVECGLTSNCLIAMVEEQTDYSSYASNQPNSSKFNVASTLNSNSNYATISSDENLNSINATSSTTYSFNTNNGIENKGTVVTTTSKIVNVNNSQLLASELGSGTDNAIAQIGPDSDFTSKGASSNVVNNTRAFEIHNSLDNPRGTYSESNHNVRTNISSPESPHITGTGIYVDGVRVNTSSVDSGKAINNMNSSESSSMNLNGGYGHMSTSTNSNNNALHSDLQDKIELLNSTIKVFEERLSSADKSNADCANLMNTVESLKNEINHLSSSLASTNSNSNSNSNSHGVIRNSSPPGKVVFVNSKNYEVQLGLFRSKRNAEKLSLKVDIDLDENKSYILQENVKGEVMYRVVYGAYDYRAEAVNAYRRINKAGYKAFVKSI